MQETRVQFQIRKFFFPILRSEVWMFDMITIEEYDVYITFGYRTFVRPLSKSFLFIKDNNRPLLQSSKVLYFETTEKRSNSKSGVWCNGSKKPRPISNNYAMDILTYPNYHLKKFNGIKYRCYQGAHRKTEKLDTLLLFHSYQDPNNKSSQSYDFKIACLGKLNDSITT